MIQTFNGFEIKPIHEGDAWKICDFMITNSDRLKRYFPNTLNENLNPTLSQLYVDNKLEQFSKKEELVFTLKHIDTRKMAGLISIIHIDWSTKQAELAYCIDYNFEGQGLTTKAISFLSHYAFKELALERLHIVIHKSNTASIKVATNNGYKWQRTLKEEYIPIGEDALDMELFELTKQNINRRL